MTTTPSSLAIERVQARLAQLEPAQVLTYVNGEDTTRATEALTVALELVGERLGLVARVDRVPPGTLRRAVLAVASELYHAQDAPDGASQWADELAAPIRRPRDPFTPARPLLAPYLGMGFA